MSVKDFQLKGNNICNVDCMDANAILHPETNVDQVKIGLLSSKTLTDWLTFNPDNPTQPFDGFDSYNGLIPWLNYYYPRGESGSIVPATKTTIGGVVIGDNLDVTEEGILSVDVESLNIPDEVSTASVDTEGTVKLGNDTRTPVNFSTSTIVDGDNYYQYPLRIDANNRTGIVIPQATFSQVQTDWNQTDTSSVDYIKNKPTIPTVNNSIVTVNQGGITKSTFSLNQNSNVTVNLDDISVATSSTIGGIKIGYVEDGELKPVLLDSGNKAYVNISNGSLKNHEVTDINQVAHDEHSNYFNTYTVRCNISNENLTVTNVNDFKQAGNGYNNIQSIDTDDIYEWNISSAGASNNIAIIHAISTAAKGYFQLIIDHNNNGEHIVETHNVGFVIDTPPTYTFAWFSTCNWNISLYGDGNIGSNACRVYLTAPSDFTGTVKITDIHLVTASGDNVGSMSNITYKKWSAGDPFSNGSVTNITGTQVTGDFKIPVDSFVTLSESPSVGDFLYDSEINDTLIHNLLVRVKTIELWIQSQQ